MARIRTIKPDFWTDEVIVRLPYEARLLFIGLWNFCDDYGCVKEEATRIHLQIFPADAALDVAALIDLLVATGLVERICGDDECDRILLMRNWNKHQKVDNPSKSRVLASPRESYRKLAIPAASRRAIALKYGCKPGESVDALCYFCGAPGKIWWPNTSTGKVGGWVAFSELELDHYETEKQGDSQDAANLVLSCRTCNRGRRDRPAHGFMLQNTREESIKPREEYGSPSEAARALARNDTSLAAEGKGKEGKGKEKPSGGVNGSTVVGAETVAAPPPLASGKADEPPPAPTRQGAIALQLRQWERERGKVTRITSQHPEVLAWAEKRVTDEQLREAYELAVIDREAAGDLGAINAGFLAVFVEKIIHPPPLRERPDRWRSSNDGIERKGRELGLLARAGETYQQYAERIDVAIRSKGNGNGQNAA